MKKKHIVLFVFALCVAPFVWSGGGSESEAESPDGVTTLELWTYFTTDWDVGAAFFDVVDSYNASQDEIFVDVQSVPFDQFKNQLTVAAASGALPDIVQLDSTDHASFAALGILADVTERAERDLPLDQVYPGALNSARYDGRLWGLPIDSNTITLIYNRTMLAEAGFTRPPDTWEELRSYAEAMSGGGVYGFTNALIQNEISTFQFLPFIWSAGGDIDRLDSPETISALEFLRGMLESGAQSPESLTWEQGSTFNQFASQRVAMYVEGPWRLPDLNEITDFGWALAPMPMSRERASVLGGENIAIIDGDPAVVEAAWEVVRFFYEPEVMLQFNRRAGMIPPRADVTEGSDYYMNDEHMRVFVEMMPSARPRGPSANWPQVSEVIQELIQAVGTGAASPEDAARDAAAAMTDVLR